ncbi:hypothetical protein PQZ46_00090 [bacterium]|jgi:hypothetical protein|nr:hypothetical protein [bacterium]
MRLREFANKNRKPLLEAEARIQHAEDIVFWEGSKGANRALQSFINMEKSGVQDVTIKWDGSPAVIFGRDTDGNFIFTDKSGFSAKGYDGKAKSADDLETMFKNRPGFAKNPEGYGVMIGKMKNAYTAFEKATPKDYKGFFKGDMLYFDTPKVQDGHYVFTPNIVTYKVTTDSSLGEQIGASKTGIVIHREVDSVGSEGPLSNADIFEGNDVLVVPPVQAQSAPQIDDTSVKELKAVIAKDAAAMDSLININTLTELKMKDLPKIFYAYMNSKVDTGLDNLGGDFMDWVNNNNKISGVKQKRIAEYITNNQQGFNALWEVVAKIQQVKDDVIFQLDNQPGAPVKQSMSSKDDSVDGGEGYVLAHPGGDIKLVPRKTFSKYNRAVER